MTEVSIIEYKYWKCTLKRSSLFSWFHNSQKGMLEVFINTIVLSFSKWNDFNYNHDKDDNTYNCGC